MSKMQMLLFATGLFVVVLMLLNFTSNMELKNSTNSLLSLNTQLISSSINSDTFCSFQNTTLPEFLTHGLTSDRFYYELNFSRVIMESDSENVFQKLVLSINEYKKNNIIDAKSVNVYGNIFLIDPSFIASSDPITSEIIGLDKISLYPRQSIKGKAVAPPNAFVALKEFVSKDAINLYIIPCTTLSKSFTDTNGRIFYSNNCEENIFKVGCYLLKEDKGNPSPNDRIPECFSITSVLSEDSGISSNSRNFTWNDCRELGYV